MKIREYEILEKIGQPGGMAVVYRARHQSLEVVRAIKKLHFHLASNSTIIKRFENEAKALSILEHPNIVKVYDFFREGADHYLIMEYVDGPSLAEILKKSAVEEMKALDYLKQILSTLSFAHSKKILHRDIKPSNILINSKGVVKVVDFGIAKMMDRKGLTSTGLTMGSPWYMSPEQIMGYELDARSDIYSLGITLFEMLSGQVPFNDTSEYKIYEMHQKQPIPSIREIDKKFSTDLDLIINKATAKDPKDRYQSAVEFSDAVDIYIALKEFGGVGSTIAEFDPSEYMKLDKTKMKSKVDIDLPTGFKTSSTVPDIKSSKPEESEKKTQLKDQIEKKDKKETAYQKATIFQDIDGTKNRYKTTSDLINHKDITGLSEKKKSFKLNRKITTLMVLFVFILATIIILLMDRSPDLLQIDQQDVSYNSVKLGWNEINEASLYNVNRKKISENKYQLIKQINTNVFVDSTVTASDSFNYQIIAKNTDGDVLAIGEANVTIPKLNINLVVTDVTSNKIALSWNRIEGNPLYVLYRLNGSNNKREVYRGNKIGFEDLYLSPEHSYSYLLGLKFSDQQEYESKPLTIMTEASVGISIPRPPPLYFGVLEVNSSPSGAKVYVDGQDYGITPLTKKGMRIGSYHVVVKKDGYKEYSTNISINADEITNINSNLILLKGYLSIQVKPFGSIYIDNQLKKENTPTKYNTELKTGTHRIVIIHKKIPASWKKDIQIKANETENILVDFTKFVKLLVTSDPWATIIIDGKSTEEVTPKLIDIRIGFHLIELRRNGYEVIGGPIYINVEQDQTINFKLKKIE